jgi:hypothetical protein
MESLNGHIPGAIESLRENYETPRITLRVLLMQLGRTISMRRIGWPGSIAIALLLIALLIAAGYFLGYPLHGAAGPD